LHAKPLSKQNCSKAAKVPRNACVLVPALLTEERQLLVLFTPFVCGPSFVFKPEIT
jgi:hypothetical protein